VRRLMLVTVLAFLWAPPGLPAQARLASVAEAAREAVARGDLAALFHNADRVQLQLPDAQPSGAVGPVQAIAALRGLLGRGDRDRVAVTRFREVGEGRGYVELRRDLVAPGREARRQRILLGYRREGGGWTLIEVRVY